MRFIHFLVPAGTELDSELVREGWERAARVARFPLSDPYFANNEPGAETLNVYADVLDPVNA